MKHYFRVPNEIFEQEIPPYALSILCYLLRCRGKDGRCFPSIQTISKSLKMSKSAVIKHTKWLEDNGYIQKSHVYKNGRQTNNNYQITGKVFGDEEPPLTEFLQPPEQEENCESACENLYQ